MPLKHSRMQCWENAMQRRIVETACRRNETHLEKPCPERTKTASQATKNEDENQGGKLLRHCKNRSRKPSSLERDCLRHQYGEQWIAVSASSTKTKTLKLRLAPHTTTHLSINACFSQPLHRSPAVYLYIINLS